MTAPKRRSRRKDAQIRATRRLHGLLVVFVLIFLGVAIKLVNLQALDAGRYVERSEQQRLRSETLAAQRGSILDRDGIELALEGTARSVAVDPSLVVDPGGTALDLARVLELDVAQIHEDLLRPGRFAWVARDVGDAKADDVVALNLPGVHLRNEPSRVYPAGDLAVSIVGSTDPETAGRAGLEKQFEDVLRGEPGRRIVERGDGGHQIPAGTYQYDDPVRGTDLVLTIDSNLQHLAERELQRAVDDLDAKNGIAILSDPRTGEILAMANVRADGEPVNARQNLAFTKTFEPGSVLKMVTAAAAIEEKVIEPDAWFDVPTCMFVGETEFCEPYRSADAALTLKGILAESSNVGTIMMAQRLGRDRLDTYLRDFGFASKTGVDFLNEERGSLLPVDEWSGTSLPTFSYGQGISTTAVQLLDAYNVIANDGVAVPSQLVAGQFVDGRLHRTEVERGERIVSTDTSRVLTDILVEVTEGETGTGSRARVDGYRVAGKTGTAWKYQLESRSYEDENGERDYTTVFAGFLPAEDPQLSMVIVIDEPADEDRQSGGTSAAPVFSAIAQSAVRLLGIPPDDAIGDLAAGQTVRAPTTLDAATSAVFRAANITPVDGFVADGASNG